MEYIACSRYIWSRHRCWLCYFINTSACNGTGTVNYLIILAITSCLFLLSGCQNYEWRYVDRHLIIPDNYEGFLVVYYECPGGTPLPDNGETIFYHYQNDGTICTSDSITATRGQLAVSDQSGQTLIPLGEPQFETGYGIYQGSTRTAVRSGTSHTFGVFWIGNYERLSQMDDYDEQFDEFLEDRFGIKKRERE